MNSTGSLKDERGNGLKMESGNLLAVSGLNESPSFIMKRRKKNISFGDDAKIEEPSNKPEWYADMDDQQVNMFKQVFEMLDSDGGGSIDAEELFSVMKQIDRDITLEEIKKTLSELDSDGNGEIDFDEFLYYMTETERYIDKFQTERRTSQRYSQRQTLFFTAITKFALNNSIGEVERYYANKARQAPHVISCYTAGVRLIGLNDRQLEQEIRRMRKAAENSSSPYAKPLPFVTIKPKKRRKHANKSTASNTPVIEECPEEEEAAVEENVEHVSTTETSNVDTSDEEEYEMDYQPTYTRQRRTAAVFDEEILNLVKDLAAGGNVVAKIPDIHLFPGLRQKIKNSEPICSSMRKKKKIQEANERQHERRIHDKKKQNAKKPLKYQPSWTIPKIEHRQTSLPVIRVPRSGKVFTIEDVPVIRKKVFQATNEYYSSLKKAHVKTACSNWDTLHPASIPSETLSISFRRVYQAYSPHKEADLLALCPWIPEFRHITRQPRVVVERLGPSPSLPGRPASRRIMSSTAVGKSRNYKLIQSLQVSSSPLLGATVVSPSPPATAAGAR